MRSAYLHMNTSSRRESDQECAGKTELCCSFNSQQDEKFYPAIYIIVSGLKQASNQYNIIHYLCLTPIIKKEAHSAIQCLEL